MTTQQLSPTQEKKPLTISSVNSAEQQPIQTENTENVAKTQAENVAKTALTGQRSGRKRKNMPPTGDITSDVKKRDRDPSKTIQKRASEKSNTVGTLRLKSGSGSTSESESERATKRKNFELMPRGFKYRDFNTPELTKLKLTYIAKFKTCTSSFIAAVEVPQDMQQISEIDKNYNEMLSSAETIYDLIHVKQSNTSGKSKDIKIDFLQDLRQLLEQSSFFEDVESCLKTVNNELKDFLIINFKQCRHDDRVKMFIPGLDLAIEKGKNSDLEKKKNEIKILHHYREVMLELANNLERIAENYELPDDFSNVQKQALAQIEKNLFKIFKKLKKSDKNENEIRKILKTDYDGVYRNLVYTSIARAIKIQVVEILWIDANKKAQQTIIRLRSDELKARNKPHALFCIDCLKEFDNSLKRQKYDVEFLRYWQHMVSTASIIYIDPERNVLLEPRRIPKPDDSNNLEKMEQYGKDLKDYGDESMALLSTKAFFGDQTFLDDFLKNAIQFSQKFMSELPPPKDPLEGHARIFNFLESLLNPLTENKQTLSEFNKALLLTNPRVISRLENIAKSNGEEHSGVEITIQFMLQFYRALNHKYIKEPISNLEELYKLIHSSKESIIKKDVKIFSTIEEKETGKEVSQPARCVYIVLGSTYFEVHSVRADQVDSGIDATFCYIYTYTTVRRAYPGELATYPHSIEFSYQIVKPKMSKQLSEKSLKEIEAIASEVNNKIKILGQLIEAAGFPRFVERIPESKGGSTTESVIEKVTESK